MRVNLFVTLVLIPQISSFVSISCRRSNICNSYRGIYSQFRNKKQSQVASDDEGGFLGTFLAQNKDTLDDNDNILNDNRNDDDEEDKNAEDDKFQWRRERRKKTRKKTTKKTQLIQCNDPILLRRRLCMQDSQHIKESANQSANQATNQSKGVDLTDFEGE